MSEQVLGEQTQSQVGGLKHLLPLFIFCRCSCSYLFTRSVLKSVYTHKYLALRESTLLGSWGHLRWAAFEGVPRSSTASTLLFSVSSAPSCIDTVPS